MLHCALPHKRLSVPLVTKDCYLTKDVCAVGKMHTVDWPLLYRVESSKDYTSYGRERATSKGSHHLANKLCLQL